MFFPNESIHTEILHEAAGVWFVESEGDDTHAILLKLPSNVLKAVIGGCQLKLSFAVVRTNNSNLLVSCAHIYDDKSAPLMVLNPHSNPADQKALFEILQRPSTPIFLYDELCRNVAWAASKWSEQPTNLMIMLSSISSSDVSHSSKEIQYALDCLQFSLDSSINIPDVEQVKLQQLELILTNFDTIDIYSYSVNDGAMRFNAADRDEGGGFEQSVWQLLESVFLRQIYKSPYVIESQSRKREFTDVFCLSEFGVFLIEAKAASV